MRDRDAAIARSERLRRALVTGSVAGSVGIAGALAIAAITGQQSSAAAGTATPGTTTPHHAAGRPHLTPAQRLLLRLENLANGSNGQTGGGSSSPNGTGAGGGLSSGNGSGHATTSGS